MDKFLNEAVDRIHNAQDTLQGTGHRVSGVQGQQVEGGLMDKAAGRAQQLGDQGGSQGVERDQGEGGTMDKAAGRAQQLYIGEDKAGGQGSLASTAPGSSTRKLQQQRNNAAREVANHINRRQVPAGNRRNTPCAAPHDYRQAIAQDPSLAEKAYLASRTQTITQNFPYALSVHDFMARLEIALHAYGFDGDNTIACANLCRDEITVTMKHEIVKVFGSTFNINGLGGVLTCGVTGIKAGLSHSPISGQGKERYVFFSFPHISVDASGCVGAISRPGRAGASCACGALLASMAQIKETGLAAACKRPGVHEPIDPELSILKQRLARRMRFEGWSDTHIKEMELVDITKVAERTISDDLEYLVNKAVDVRRADYAVVTGVQIHNLGVDFDDHEPNFEFIAPTGVYVVINGHKSYLDLEGIPALTPRQVEGLTGGRRCRPQPASVINTAGPTTVRSIDAPFLYSSQQEVKEQKERAATYAQLLEGKELPLIDEPFWPLWKANLVMDGPTRDSNDNSTFLEEELVPSDDLEHLTTEFLERLSAIAKEDLSTAKQ